MLHAFSLAISSLIMVLYSLSLLALIVYGVHRYWMVYLYWRYRDEGVHPQGVLPDSLAAYPVVTVQLPLFNEKYVAERLIRAVSAFDYPREKLEIQVLDDSTDETVERVAKVVRELASAGFDIGHLRRPRRAGFKAGALAWGTSLAKGEFLAIFDADFIPPPDFLKKTLPYFSHSPVGMVQTRWGHVNANYSLLTRLQALFLDGHFLLEHTARNRSGAFFNFNGTAGIWRKKAIESAGGWSSRTLTEDLDLSYRAQLKGWQFIYLPDFVCPAELPVDIYALRSQQFRWAKGAIQVARFILKDLWKARISLHTKVEATLHLTANVGYFLSVIISLFLLPSLLLRSQCIFWGTGLIESAAFLATTVSITFFYSVALKELYPNWKWKMRDIPALLSFGIGMCLHNAAAVWEGLRGKDSDFIRTPKFGVETALDTWAHNEYRGREREVWKSQFFFSLYLILTFFIAASRRNWESLPFIFLFVFGFSYVAYLSIRHSPRRS